MNQDMFAWSHKDMPGIDPSVIVHRLNVNLAPHPSDRKSECSYRTSIAIRTLQAFGEIWLTDKPKYLRSS